MVSDFHNDAVSHPEHYGENENGIECIEVTECMNFNVGNAVKYLWRAGRKGDGFDAHIQDLEKAAQYVQFEIERVERAKKRSEKSEGLKSGHLYVSPLDSSDAREWTQVGYTSEGISETVDYPHQDQIHLADFGKPVRVTTSFRLDEVSRENLARVLGHGQFRSDGVVVKKFGEGTPNVVPKSENGCCSQGFYSEGKQHSVSCDVEKVKNIADKHANKPYCPKCAGTGPFHRSGCDAHRAMLVEKPATVHILRPIKDDPQA